MKNEYKIESGLIFGADFSLYGLCEKNEEHYHSELLVFFVNEQWDWKMIYEKIRLSHEVNKKCLIIKVVKKISTLEKKIGEVIL
jgi:tRNA splicing endonuclease